jgi:hypothetical protein
MIKKNKSQNRSVWSGEMIKEFLDIIVPGSLTPILFHVQEKKTQITFESNKSKYIIESSYIGVLVRNGLDDVYFSLNSYNEGLEDAYFSSAMYVEGEQDYQNYMGYFELLNGIIYDEGRKVPMIRGFIKHDVGFFETVDSLIRDSIIFNQKTPILLEIYPAKSHGSIISYFKTGEINTDDIFYKKIFIESIEVSQKLSVVY